MRAKCVVDKVALGQVFLRLILFPPVIIIPYLLHTLLRLHAALIRSTNEKKAGKFWEWGALCGRSVLCSLGSVKHMLARLCQHEWLGASQISFFFSQVVTIRPPFKWRTLESRNGRPKFVDPNTRVTFCHNIVTRYPSSSCNLELQYWKWGLGTEEKRGTTFRSSTDGIFETLTWNDKSI